MFKFWKKLNKTERENFIFSIAIFAIVIYIVYCCFEISTHSITDQMFSWWNILQYIG